MEDDRIIALFFAHSEQAITELSQKYGRRLLQVARNFLQDEKDARECVNDAYLAVWQTIPPRRPEQLAGYVCRIVRNQALGRYHAAAAEKRGKNLTVALGELADCVPAADSVEGACDAAALTASINRFLADQTPENRVLFVRRYYCGDSVETTAAAIGIGAHTASARLYRLRERLRIHLRKDGIEL